MPRVDFFWDPMCPWAWLASRWLVAVEQPRQLDIDWRFVALRLVNKERDYSAEFPPGYLEHHDRSHRLLRVAAAARAEHGPGVVAPLYRAYGQMIHDERRHQVFDGPDGRGLAEALARSNLAPELAGAADDDSFDPALQLDVDEGFARVGPDVGTPIISLDPPHGPSIFGPVLSRELVGDEAVRFWDAFVTVISEPGFAELKRRRRRRSEFGRSAFSGDQALDGARA